MFLHLGGNVVVPKKDLIVILDAQAEESQSTREFLEIAGDEGFIKDITGNGKKKSFVVTAKDIYISPISCGTLKKRAENFLEL